jgi:endonuclease VIII
MPEGDTIHRAASTLDRALRGKIVRRFVTPLPRLARVDEDHPLAGRTIDSVSAVGKHLLFRFSGDLVLLTHMRMNGSWHIYRPGERWQRSRTDMRIAIYTDEYVAVAFSVPIAEFHSDRSLGRSRVRSLGADILAPAFDADAAVAALRHGPDRSIAEALLDQRAVAGIGNVYKSEVLFLCRVHPDRRLVDLPDETLRAIVDTARRLMTANVQAGTSAGIVTYRGLRRTRGRQAPGEHVWVYGRARRPCRVCGSPVQVRKQGLDARSTYWCARCQA